MPETECRSIHALDQIHQRELFLESLISNIPGMVYQLVSRRDGRHEMTYVSPKAWDLFEIRAESSLSATQILPRIIDPEEKALFTRSSEEALLSNGPFRWTGRIRLDSGKQKWVHVTSMPRKLEHGDVIWDGMVVDVSAQKEAEAELKASQARLLESQKIAHVGTWERDIETGKIWWTEEQFAIYGLDPKSVDPTYEQYLACVHPEDRARVSSLISNSITRREPFDFDFRIIRPDGEVRYLNSRARFQEVGNGSLRFFGTTQDLTEKVLAERQMETTRARAITASKMSALGEMAGGIAHEINNPLTVIHGRATQLKSMVEEGPLDPERVGAIAEKIEATSLRISRIIKSLRAVARNADQDPFQQVPIETVLRETLEFCRHRIASRDVRLEVGPLPAGLQVECRPVQISQILLNLLNNSLDAVESSESRWIRISVSERDRHVAIQVEDSGHGVPVESREKLFQPFFTHKPPGQGTGLGLSLSRAIAEEHRGTLILDSSAPHHTTFVLTLPKEQPSRPDA